MYAFDTETNAWHEAKGVYSDLYQARSIGIVSRVRVILFTLHAPMTCLTYTCVSCSFLSPGLQDTLSDAAGWGNENHYGYVLASLLCCGSTQ